MHASARRILTALGRTADTTIHLDDATDHALIIAATRLNGDGVVPSASADDPAIAAVLLEISACVGGMRDRSGVEGVDRDHLDLLSMRERRRR